MRGGEREGDERGDERRIVRANSWLMPLLFDNPIDSIDIHCTSNRKTDL